VLGRSDERPCPNAPRLLCFCLGAGDNAEDGWGVAAVRRGQEHACFEAEYPSADLGGKVELTGNTELCSAQKAAPHGAR
jgi:hypothetical protein